MVLLFLAPLLLATGTVFAVWVFRHHRGILKALAGLVAVAVLAVIALVIAANWEAVGPVVVSVVIFAPVVWYEFRRSL